MELPKLDSWTSGFNMFKSDENQRLEMMSDNSSFTFHRDRIIIDSYPFKPSIAFKNNTITPKIIDSIDLKSFPPTIKINEELIFIPATQKKDLETFAEIHNIKIVQRNDLWSWILEPFLDTEYTAETDDRMNTLLSRHGLSKDDIKALRTEVKDQMLIYNFDTMLWEWCDLGLKDVLKAMRTKYSDEEFRSFYLKAMSISQLPENSPPSR